MPATRIIKLLLTVCFLQFMLTSGTYADVYICKGPASKKYHYSPNCRGLSNCSTPISKVSLEEARRLGRGLCGWED